MQDVKIRIEVIKSKQPHNNFQSYVDPILWNCCVLDRCRGITVSTTK